MTYRFRLKKNWFVVGILMLNYCLKTKISITTKVIFVSVNINVNIQCK